MQIYKGLELIVVKGEGASHPSPVAQQNVDCERAAVSGGNALEHGDDIFGLVYEVYDGSSLEVLIRIVVRRVSQILHNNELSSEALYPFGESAHCLLIPTLVLGVPMF